MKFEFKWPVVSEKVMFQYIDGTPIYLTLAERSKVNLDLWNLFIAIVSVFNISIRLQQYSK